MANKLQKIENFKPHNGIYECVTLTRNKLPDFHVNEWIEKNTSKKDIKLKQLHKIELLVKEVATKQGCIGIESVDDCDGYFEKFFIAKIPKNMSVSDRRKTFDKIINEIIPICEKNGLIELFMKTSIFLRR